MHPGSHVLRGCSAPQAILPQSPPLCQNGGLSVVSSITETEKSRVDEDESHVVFGQKFPGGKGSVRRCVVLMQQPVLSVAKVQSEIAGVKFSEN
jgi:hypothetical protein